MHTNLFTLVLIVIISVLIKGLIVVRTETVSAR